MHTYIHAYTHTHTHTHTHTGVQLLVTHLVCVLTLYALYMCPCIICLYICFLTLYAFIYVSLHYVPAKPRQRCVTDVMAQRK